MKLNLPSKKQSFLMTALIALIFNSIVLSGIAYSKAAPTRIPVSPWKKVGTLGQSQSLPGFSLKHCNLRVRVEYNEPSNNALVQVHYYPKQSFYNTPSGYQTLQFDVGYTGMYIFKEAGILDQNFFQTYINDLANPQLNVLENIMYVSVYPQGGQPNVNIWYRTLDTNGNFSGPTVQPGFGNLLTLEKQCP